MNWKFTTLVSGAGLLATWLGVSSTPSREAGDAPRSAARASQPAEAASDIEEQAARLRVGVHDAVRFQPPTRDPFRFGRRRTAADLERDEAAVLEPAPPAPLAPPVPVLTLAGIKIDAADTGATRTAIISTPGGVILVREGDAVGADYRVSTIDDESVDLLANDGSTRRLTFSSR